MDWMFLFDIIRQHGYISLFLIMAVGLFFFPVPNEVLLMTGGLLATTYYLEPLPTFFILFASVMFHGTILYVSGHVVSKRAHLPVKRKKSIWHERAEKGKELLEKYGLKAASFSYFFPFIRHAVPFSIGLSNIPYRLFALVGFSSAFVWLTFYFLIGFYYGRTITDWSSFVEHMIYALAILGCLVLLYHFIKKRRQRNRGYDH